IILVKPVKGQPRAATLEMLTETGSSALAEIDLPFEFRGRYLAAFAKHYTSAEDVSIIYRNEPKEADKIAGELSDLCEEIEDDELADFAEFLEHEIHQLYRLGTMVRRGIGFHYGYIPQIVRSGIEELARRRKLKYVC